MASAFHRMNAVRQSKGQAPNFASSSSTTASARQKTSATTPRLSSGDRLLGQLTTKLARHRTADSAEQDIGPTKIHRGQLKFKVTATAEGSAAQGAAASIAALTSCPVAVGPTHVKMTTSERPLTGQAEDADLI